MCMRARVHRLTSLGDPHKSLIASKAVRKRGRNTRTPGASAASSHTSTLQTARARSSGTLTAPVTGTSPGGTFSGTLTVTKFVKLNHTLNAVGTLSGTLTSTAGTVIGTVTNVPVTIPITAVSGPGNLLGNLLCAIANLLNGGGPLTSLRGLLNQILARL